MYTYQLKVNRKKITVTAPCFNTALEEVMSKHGCARTDIDVVPSSILTMQDYG